MTKEKIKQLLEGLKDVEMPDKTMDCEEFGKCVYSSPIGKRIIDELRKEKVSGEVLRKNGFIAAMLSLGWILNPKNN